MGRASGVLKSLPRKMPRLTTWSGSKLEYPSSIEAQDIWESLMRSLGRSSGAVRSGGIALTQDQARYTAIPVRGGLFLQRGELQPQVPGAAVPLPQDQPGRYP